MALSHPSVEVRCQIAAGTEATTLLSGSEHLIILLAPRGPPSTPTAKKAVTVVVSVRVAREGRLASKDIAITRCTVRGPAFSDRITLL